MYRCQRGAPHLSRSAALQRLLPVWVTAAPERSRFGSGDPDWLLAPVRRSPHLGQVSLPQPLSAACLQRVAHAPGLHCPPGPCLLHADPGPLRCPAGFRAGAASTLHSRPQPAMGRVPRLLHRDVSSPGPAWDPMGGSERVVIWGGIQWGEAGPPIGFRGPGIFGGGGPPLLNFRRRPGAEEAPGAQAPREFSGPPGASEGPRSRDPEKLSWGP